MLDLKNSVSNDTMRDYDLLREDCGILDLSDLAMVAMTGDDRKGWLQGQATNDLRKLDFGASSEFCLTSVTGHMISVCEVWALADRLLLTCPRITVDSLLRRVDQMVIMEDVAAKEVSKSVRLISVQGPSATNKLAALMAMPSLDAGESEFEGTSVCCLRSNRTGLGGWDLWISSDESGAIRAVEDAFPSIGREAYNIARLEAGIPLFGIDMGEKTFPPEMGQTFESRHVSYSKGCYMGQEVLMRIHSRGHTNKTWVGLASEQSIEQSATVKHLHRQDAGIVTSSVYSPDFGYIAAAMLRNEAAFDGEQVQVITNSGTVDAEVRMMPFLRMG